MSKKERRKHQPQPRPKLFFSLSTVRLLKEALCTFERRLVQGPRDLPNLAFAKEVVSGLKTKVEDMLQREEWEKETPFDYNEAHILHVGLHMYLLELMYSRQGDLLMPCITLCRQFSLIVEHAHAKQ